MANPRQRRKLRSGSHKPVQHSRQAKKLLKKQPPICGPKVLQDAWDKHKTVRQNYEALGFLSTLNPVASGGVEVQRKTVEHPHSATVAPEPSETTAGGGANDIPKGYGKIIRDENGDVVDVLLGEDEPEGPGEPASGVEEVMVDFSAQSPVAGWIALGAKKSHGLETSNSHVVQALERTAKTDGGRIPRFTSKGERAVLRRLVEKYKEDVEAMSRDRKLNPDQRTAGELTRAIKKSGGFTSLMKGG